MGAVRRSQTAATELLNSVLDVERSAFSALVTILTAG